MTFLPLRHSCGALSLTALKVFLDSVSGVPAGTPYMGPKGRKSAQSSKPRIDASRALSESLVRRKIRKYKYKGV